MSSYPERPKRISSEVIDQVAYMLASALQEHFRYDHNWFEGEDDLERLHTRLRKILAEDLEWEGYRLAKRLETRRWVPTTDVVNILNKAIEVSFLAHQHAITTWVHDHQLKPHYNQGDHVEFLVPGSEGEPILGKIFQVFPDTIEYQVQVTTSTGPVTLRIPEEVVCA
jgi:hypothetical protein